jgi:hypothetical protein
MLYYNQMHVKTRLSQPILSKIVVTLIMNAYRGATTVVLPPQGTTEPIPDEAGVK